MDLNEKISALRREMLKNEVDIYLITTEDAYLAESAVDYWRTLRWLTGFSGTLAYAMVSQDKVTFWTDARYIIQANHQVKIEGVEYYDVTKVGADYYLTWIEEEISRIEKEKVVFATDGRTITAAKGRILHNKIAGITAKKAIFRADLDLVGNIWEDRPEPAYRPIFEHELKYTGYDRKEKLAQVRKGLEDKGADCTIVGTMEGVVWLTNMRGQDIVNPLFMSHVLVTPETAKLFARLAMIPEELQEKLKDDGYELCEIEEIGHEMSKLKADNVVYYDEFRINYQLYSFIPPHTKKVQGFDLVNDLKAIKNPVEIQNFIHTNALESAAFFKMITYIKKHVGEGTLNEYNASNILYQFRSEIREYEKKEAEPIMVKYPVMAAYMENAAGPHYFPTEDDFSEIKPEGILLIDAVGHYLGGTTDITRTIYLGPCQMEAELKHDYTLTLRSFMDLARQVFREGVDGAYLDSVARRVMWNEYLHYGYGTGHGVGYCIVPHEGPQFISEPSYKKEWAFCFLPLKPGMVMAIEPGVYKKGKYGVRIEDNIYIAEDRENEFGKFYHFIDMTTIPFEKELIDVNMLHDDEIEWINEYHRKAREVLTPFMNEEEKEELEKATAPITR